MKNKMSHSNNGQPPKLSICIATYNRGVFIEETLESIISQMPLSVEVIVVDGASPDNTADIMAKYVSSHPEVRYFREPVNSGVDADFDKAVGYARGEFCWLMTDDDLLRPDAIKKLLSVLDDENDLIVVNSEVRNIDLSVVLQNQRLVMDADRLYSEANCETFFSDTADYLSFIGCVVIRRTCWLARNRIAYYGSLFIHVGVIFQSPCITNVRVIAEPLVIIRYGNAMWTSRSFEIWMFMWPKLIWSFSDFSDTAKTQICQSEPWRHAKWLFYYRALGSYTVAEFRKFCPSDVGKLERGVAYVLSIFPAPLANLIIVLYFALSAKPVKTALVDLLSSSNASVLSHFFARALGDKSCLKCQ